MNPNAEDRAVPDRADGPIEIEEFLAIVRRRLLNVLESRGVEANLAEDLVQEGLALVWLRLPQLRQPERVMSWAVSILLNRLRSHCAKGRPTIEVLEECPGPGEGPLDAVLREEREAQCITVLGALGPKLRAAILMCHEEGLSVELASARLGVSQSSLRQHLRKTLRRVRNSLGIVPPCRTFRFGT